MDNPRPEKVAVVDEVRERLGAANAAILTEYRGLPVKDLEALRRSLTAAGGSYKVYKNTLVGFAARDLGLDLDPLLTGPTAIAFVDGDAAEVAKALREFARTHPLLVIKGGLLGKSVLSPADTAALADLPSREVMLARVAGALAAPMVQFAGLLQALPRNFAYGLKALIDKGGAGDAPAPAASTAPDTAATTADAPSADSAPAAAAAASGDTALAADAPAPDTAASGDTAASTADAPSAGSAPAADAAAGSGDTALAADAPAPDAAGSADTALAADAPAPATAEPAGGASATDQPTVTAESGDDGGTPPTTEQPTEGAPEAAPGEGGPSDPEPTPPSTDQPAEGAADAAPAADSSTPTDPAQES